VDKRVGGRLIGVIPLTRAISERIKGGYDDALYKSTFTLLYFTSPGGGVATVPSALRSNAAGSV